MTKQCPKCAAVKPVSEFYKNKTRYDGLASVCVPCSKAYQASSMRSNPDCGKEAAARHRSTPKGRIGSLVAGARVRAEAAGLPCTITHAWVEERVSLGFCEVTGIKFQFEKDGRGKGYRNPFIPSLDQIIPKLGYTPENTQVVVWTYNAAKGAGDHADVMKLAEALCHVH